MTTVRPKGATHECAPRREGWNGGQGRDISEQQTTRSERGSTSASSDVTAAGDGKVAQ